MKYLSLASSLIAAILATTAPLNAQETPENIIAEQPITAAGPQGDLAGSYIDAGQDTPVLMIIAGSGPTDRDGNNPLGIRANSYKLLAKALANMGISSLRADKRGMFGSAAAIPNPNDVSIKAYGDDVNAWAATIKERSGHHCIWLAGHSEGALVALAAAQDNDNICGVITIAGPGRPLDEVLREQLSSNPANAPILADANRALIQLKAGKTLDVSNMHPALQGLFNPAVQPFMIDLFAYDPAALASTLNKPLLIIQGDNDIQVSVQDAEILAKANPKAALAIIPNMNHVLKPIESKNRAVNAQSYANPSLPLSPELADIIAKFIQKK